MKTRLYRSGVLEAEDFDAALISDYLDEPDTVVWLDLLRPTPEDFDVVAEEFGLHPLAREDAMHASQRPKLEPFEGHQFLVAYAASYNTHAGELDTFEIAVFFDDRWLITVRQEPEFAIEPVLARWDNASDLAGQGVSFLLHGILDDVVDGHFNVVNELDAAVETLEDDLFEPGGQALGLQRRTYEIRKALVELRRVVLPMREVVNRLLRGDICSISQEMQPYYQDVYDHVLRATEWTESLRDLITSVLETHLTIQGNKLNEIMKKLTSYAAIVAVPTAIAGVYGMNTRIYPAANSVLGWWVAISLIVGVSTLLFFYFRNKDWL